MLLSNVQFIRETQCVTPSVSQDTYDTHDDEEEDTHSHDASLDNFYDALTERDPGAIASLSDIRINMDPTERLIEAMETLREVIVDNTNAQHRPKRRGGGGTAGNRQGVTAPVYRANGSAVIVKDDKLKIRKDKVSGPLLLQCITK
jgi:hypothetical protein